jgi:hypothetical protein
MAENRKNIGKIKVTKSTGRKRVKVKLKFFSELICKFRKNYNLITKIVRLLDAYSKKILPDKYSNNYTMNILDILNCWYSQYIYCRIKTIIFSKEIIYFIKQNEIITINSIETLDKSMKCVELLIEDINYVLDVDVLYRKKLIIEIILENLIYFCVKTKYLCDNSHKMLYRFIFHCIYKYNWYIKFDCEVSLIKYISLIKRNSRSVINPDLLNILYEEFMNFTINYKIFKLSDNILFKLRIKKIFHFIGMFRHLAISVRDGNGKNRSGSGSWELLLLFSIIITDINMFKYTIQFIDKECFKTILTSGTNIYQYLIKTYIQIENINKLNISSIINSIRADKIEAWK